MDLDLDDQEQAIGKLIQLVQFPTVSATAGEDGSYVACADWLVEELGALGLGAFILPESLPNKPIVVGYWTGSSPELPCVLLNSHYDVVPILLEHWSVPAFQGLRKDGKIFGRGTQDMKCVCAQYLISIKKLKENGYLPTRTINITYVPDEEIGGADGMNIMLNSLWFKTQKIAIALDEGLANTGDVFSVFYGERLPWWVHITATGNTGHGSRFIDGSAIQQVIEVCNKALYYREQQKDLLHGTNHHAGCSHAVVKKKALTLGDVTTINVTMLRAGIQAGGKDIINVIPPNAEAGFDIRISPHIDPSEISKTLDTWCEEVNEATPGLLPDQGVKWNFFYEPLQHHAVTSVEQDVNPWWKIFAETLWNEFQVEVVPEVGSSIFAILWHDT
jgi:aminoacylase